MEIKEIARKNFYEWAQALRVKDPKVMAEFYSEDATFLPTLSPEVKRGIAEAEGYFAHFLEKNPIVQIGQESIQPLGEDVYLHSGMYDFEVGPKGAREKVEARFSYVWRKFSKGNWKIIHHHSSLKPQ